MERRAFLHVLRSTVARGHIRAIDTAAAEAVDGVLAVLIHDNAQRRDPRPSSMALHEHSLLDPRTGHVVNHDLAGYHIATNADVADIDAVWIDEHATRVSTRWAPRGSASWASSATAAAIANAVS